jgi:hypothetical protein
MNQHDEKVLGLDTIAKTLDQKLRLAIGRVKHGKK